MTPDGTCRGAIQFPTNEPKKNMKSKKMGTLQK
jgi:hypothetical protein